MNRDRCNKAALHTPVLHIVTAQPPLCLVQHLLKSKKYIYFFKYIYLYIKHLSQSWCIFISLGLMKCNWIIGDQFNFARETRSGRCCSFNGAETFGRCGLWHLHGQDLWEDHRSGTALWHPTQLQSCFLYQLHRYLEKNEGLPGGCHQVSLVSLPFSLILYEWVD